MSLVADPLAFISSALAPVVSLSACAILASNAQNQYSSLVDRLRALNAERREVQADPTPNDVQVERLKSLDHQIPVIFRRTRRMRDAIFMLFLGMLFILLSSFMIVTMETFKTQVLSLVSEWCFFIGLLFVFFAIAAKLEEVILTFRVVRYELGMFDRKTAREAEREFKGY